MSITARVVMATGRMSLVFTRKYDVAPALIYRPNSDWITETGTISESWFDWLFIIAT
jgi:hypothetical protein